MPWRKLCYNLVTQKMALELVHGFQFPVFVVWLILGQESIEFESITLTQRHIILMDVKIWKCSPTKFTYPQQHRCVLVDLTEIWSIVWRDRPPKKAVTFTISIVASSFDRNSSLLFQRSSYIITKNIFKSMVKTCDSYLCHTLFHRLAIYTLCSNFNIIFSTGGWFSSHKIQNESKFNFEKPLKAFGETARFKLINRKIAQRFWSNFVCFFLSFFHRNALD